MKVRNSKDVDRYFAQRRKNADTANRKVETNFYNMMRNMGAEMNRKTSALTLPSESDSGARVLDLCIAPGGFSAATLELNPMANIDGVSLPLDEGGHRVILPCKKRNGTAVHIMFGDITMFAAEYGVDLDSIPSDHPDADKFSPRRPYNGRTYDLVFCDGQVLRTHKRKDYREECEATRLTNAQLILGLQRIKPGGTMIVLLHNLDTWRTMELVRSFDKFATVELFKSVKAHVIVSSFYMIAKAVQPQSQAAQAALRKWKQLWHRATFGTNAEPIGDEVAEDVSAILNEFGPRLVELGRDIWRTQADALENGKFMKNKNYEKEKVREAKSEENSALNDPGPMQAFPTDEVQDISTRLLEMSTSAS